MAPGVGWGASWSVALAAALALGGPGCTRRAAREPALHHIVIDRFRYQPAVLVVASGDTVEWMNHDLVPHTASASSRSWDSQSIAPGASWRTVVHRRAVETYGCLFHPIMKARLVVR